MNTRNMKILITGIAGFIGFHLAKKLNDEGHEVAGIDNMNDYYSPQLKTDRLKELGFHFNLPADIRDNEIYTSGRISFSKTDICDAAALQQVFSKTEFDIVINLAAQAGVRYSIKNPSVYIQSNITGFFNILECVRASSKKCDLIYASSSSVYGNNKVPFSAEDKTDEPVSVYAATKKANEALANAYAALYGMSCTGLRFFTVYGPWGRPDMAYFSFTEKILKGESIDVFNNGDLLRDFTYIDDITDGICAVVKNKKPVTDKPYYHKIYNIGNNSPVKLLDFINTISRLLGKEAAINMKPMQPGDVYATFADILEIQNDYGFQPTFTIESGLSKFIEWYQSYYNKD